jgi:hypothetical protein
MRSAPVAVCCLLLAHLVHQLVPLLLLADHHASQLLHVAQVRGVRAQHSLPARVVIGQQRRLWLLPLLALLLLLVPLLLLLLWCWLWCGCHHEALLLFQDVCRHRRLRRGLQQHKQHEL